jgi:DNA-binding NarL/FixJ family response regulator
VSIRILLADDQTLVRSGFKELLERSDGIEVIGEVADGRAAVERTRADRPDVVLMDIRMPVMDGLEATRTIAADPRLIDVRVIMLTTFDLDEYVFEALHAGASGFLLKDVGLSNREIAERLIISPATAKTHVSRILLKLDARDRAQLVVIAYQSGLVKTRPVTS